MFLSGFKVHVANPPKHVKGSKTILHAVHFSSYSLTVDCTRAWRIPEQCSNHTRCSNTTMSTQPTQPTVTVDVVSDLM